MPLLESPSMPRIVHPSSKKLLRKRVFSLLVGLVLLSIPFPADAIRPFLTTETAVPIEHGKSLLLGGFKYERFASNDREYTLQGELRYGLITNLDFEVEVPLLIGDFPDGHETGLGDLRLKTKVRFLKGREANPLSLAGMLDIKFPSASRDKGFGTGEPDIGLLGIASKEFFPVTVHLNLGYTLVGNPPGQDLRDELKYSLGMELETVLSGLIVVGELSGKTSRKASVSQRRLDLLGGAVVNLAATVSFDFSLILGLINTSPDFGFSSGLAYRF